MSLMTVQHEPARTLRTPEPAPNARPRTWTSVVGLAVVAAVIALAFIQGTPRTTNISADQARGDSVIAAQTYTAAVAARVNSGRTIEQAIAYLEAHPLPFPTNQAVIFPEDSWGQPWEGKIVNDSWAVSGVKAGKYYITFSGDGRTWRLTMQSDGSTLWFLLPVTVTSQADYAKF